MSVLLTDCSLCMSVLLTDFCTLIHKLPLKTFVPVKSLISLHAHRYKTLKASSQLIPESCLLLPVKVAVTNKVAHHVKPIEPIEEVTFDTICIEAPAEAPAIGPCKTKQKKDRNRQPKPVQEEPDPQPVLPDVPEVPEESAELREKWEWMKGRKAQVHGSLHA